MQTQEMPTKPVIGFALRRISSFLPFPVHEQKELCVGLLPLEGVFDLRRLQSLDPIYQPIGVLFRKLRNRVNKANAIETADSAANAILKPYRGFEFLSLRHTVWVAEK
jgi:hypothetical protein